MSEVSSINSNEIISILKEEIENFDMMSKDSEAGTVITVGDGIASIYGIDRETRSAVFFSEAIQESVKERK